MLEPILKGLVEWLYEMMVEIMAYASGELIGVMSMDLSYFERTAPVISTIINIFIALGWALLIGNLVFQSLKVMMSGAGFEAEDPKILFLRTFVFAFLLLASRQICTLCSSMTGLVINMLNLPASINVTTPDESMFSLGSGAKWLLVIIVGVVLMVQMVKLLFEIGERYVITSVLTFFAPLAFAMGGSKNTNDIFKGWCRMYGSMLIMMIMNIVFLKLIMSAMSQMAAGGVLVWLVFVVALTRVARKIDSHIGKIGLNPAQTGNEIGSRFPGMMTMMAVRVMSSTIGRSMAGAKGNSGKSGSSGNRRRPSGVGFGMGGNRTTNTAGGNSSSYAAGSQTGYTGGGTNVNNTGGTNAGKPTASGTTNNSMQAGGNTMGGSSPNANTVKPRNAPLGQKPISAGAGGHTSNQAVNRTSNQSTQNNGQTNVGAASGAAKNPIGSRPPIPRGTAGGNPMGKNAMNSVMQNSSQNVSNSEGGKPAGINKSGASQKNTPPPIIPPVRTGGVNQSVIGNVTKNGNKSVPSKGCSQSNSDAKGSFSNENNVSGGNAHSTEIGGNHGGINLGGNTQMYSEHSDSDHFADRHTEHSRENKNNSFTQMQGRTETTERRVNHEYKHGRYNPAAANKKSKNSYYQKDDLKKRYKKNQGEDDGKHKR